MIALSGTMGRVNHAINQNRKSQGFVSKQGVFAETRAGPAN